MNNAPKLTPEQKRILLVLCEAADHGMEKHGYAISVQLVATNKVRETVTAHRLAKKGFARLLKNGRWTCTDEGYWLGDTLRIEDRQGKIPPRA